MAVRMKPGERTLVGHDNLVTQHGRHNHVVGKGDANTAVQQGHDCLALHGNGNAVSQDGYSTAAITGNRDYLREHGRADHVSITGDGQKVDVEGSRNNVNVDAKSKLGTLKVYGNGYTVNVVNNNVTAFDANGNPVRVRHTKDGGLVIGEPKQAHHGQHPGRVRRGDPVD